MAKIVLGFFLAVFSMEVVAWRYYNVETVEDPSRGTVFRPGHTNYYRLEGNGEAHFVEHGIRRSTAWSASGSPAILALGDSFTEALQVTDEEVYTGLLESGLAANGMRCQVLNLGTSASSIADYISDAKRLRGFYRPTWVVIQVTDDDFTRDAWNPAKAHFAWTKDGQSLLVENPVLNQPPQGRWMRWIGNHFAVARFAWERLSQIRAQSDRQPPLFNIGKHRDAGGPAPSTSAGVYPLEQEVAALSGAFEGRLTLLYVAAFDPRAPSAPSPVERQIVELARKDGISIVDIRSRYPAIWGERQAPFGFPNTRFNRGHLNAAGHRAAAELLTGELLRMRADAFH